MLQSSIASSAETLSLDIAADVVGRITQKAGALPQIVLAYEGAIKTVWLTIKPEPKPIFNLALLNSINKVQRAIHDLWGPDVYEYSPVRFLAYRGEGPIFTLGGDLEFYLDCIGGGDRAGLEEYANASREGAIWNASSLNGAAITIATVHAKALGGGIDAPRSCNVMIAERQVTFCYPEVKFNHFPITAVAVLSRHMGPLNAFKTLSDARELSAEEFKALGGLEAVIGEGEGENWVRRYAEDTLSSHSARLALFSAFHRQTAAAFDAELAYLANNWVDSMMRMNSIDIARLQRIVAAQNRMLARAKPAAKNSVG